MGRARASVIVPGRISDAEAVWYDPDRWPTWVDGFGYVNRVDEAWPAAGARVEWDSRAGGRGRVLEHVVRHEARVGQVLEVEDGQIRGTQTVSFVAEGGDQTRVTLELEYEIKEGSPLTPVVDLLFVRRAWRDSLRRTLARFAVERRADAELS